MRCAFLTTEFVTNFPDIGGLATYLHRLCQLLVERGDQPEVFVSSTRTPRLIDLNGIRVEHVPPFSSGCLGRIPGLFGSVPGPWASALYVWCQALALAGAMERRHRAIPFNIVQSSDYLAVGLAVRRRKGRVHLVRCSTAADLYDQFAGPNVIRHRMREKIERLAMRRADRAYAPSDFVARHYRERHGLKVDVVRPPFTLDTPPSPEPPCGLPQRYLVHFGQLIRRKGTHLVGAAFARALRKEASLRLVIVGVGKPDEVESFLSPLRADDRRKLQLLYPLHKADLYAVVQRAEGSLAPSLVDNLPNSVLESLMLGVPVIGTRGASIDEVVEDGVNGELVPASDVEALAAAMIKLWRRESSCRKGFVMRSPIAQEMRPDRAIERWLQFALPAEKYAGAKALLDAEFPPIAD